MDESARIEALEAELESTRVALQRLVFLLRERRLLADVEVEAIWDVERSAPGPSWPSDVVADCEPRPGEPGRRTPSTPPAPMPRSTAGRIGALTRWSQEPDRSAATQPARDGLQRRFEREVDPHGVLDPVELAKRAESARRAHFQRMAARSAQSRAAKRRGVVEGEARRDDGD